MADRFFINIDEQQQGPFSLEELEAHGVGPDTYVWCKGMAKWRKARDVADICRYWRQRLAGDYTPANKGTTTGATQPAQPDQNETSIPEDGNITPAHFRTIRSFNPADPEPGTNFDAPPLNLIFPSILATLMCMPLIGLIGVYFAAKAQRSWRESQQEGIDVTRATELKKAAHDATRSAKMWIGISFFFGFILYAVIFRFML